MDPTNVERALKRKDVRTRAIAIFVFLLVLGLLLLAFSDNLEMSGEHPVWTGLVRELGIVVLSVLGVAVIYELFLAEKYLAVFQDILRRGESISATCARLGVQEILESRLKLSFDEVETRVANCKEAVDLLGVSHTEILVQPSFVECLKKRIADGAICRVLLLDPTEGSTEPQRRMQHEREGAALHALIKVSKANMVKCCGDLNRTPSDILRFYPYSPPCMIIRVDDWMLVAPYVYGRAARSPALLLIRPDSGGLFDMFLDHFNRTWDAHAPNPPLQPAGSAGG